MKAFRTLLRVEGKLVLRHPDVILFALLFPVGMVILLGIIYGGKPAYEGAAYTFIEQSFGAVASVGICASGLMGMPLNLSDYRHRKILRRYKVTPVSPGVLLAVQVLLHLAVAAVSALLVFSAAALLFGYRMAGSIWPFIGAYLIVALAVFGMGMLITSLASTMKTANTLCTVLYFPMLFLSGATIPYEVMPDAMQKAVNVLPLTQGIKLLKAFSLGTGTDGLMWPLVLLPVLAVVCTAVSIKYFKWE
jgi:ABC-2 type transport system permease protein